MTKYYGRELDITLPPDSYDTSQIVKHHLRDFPEVFAHGEWTKGNGFLLKEGSYLRKDITCRTNDSIKSIQDDLIDDKVIIASNQNDFFVLLKDVLVSSPSSAACLFCGNDRNGGRWKTSNGGKLPKAKRKK